MGEWEMFQRCVWRRPSFTVLSPDARLLFLWSWTNPDEASLSGLYPASPRQLSRALAENGNQGARVADALSELAARPLVLYDESAEVLWVVGRVDHTLKSPTQAVKMRREFDACPPSPLRDMFRRHYGEKLRLKP